MQGKLFICATPIGNLGDITARVLEEMKQAHVIAAEDMRNSIKLLNHFQISTPMTSYHEHNKLEKGEQLIAQMKEGKNVVLISDAGTPAISDPGEELVKMCYEANIEVTSLPGPSACITALTLSGLSTRRFCFEGFLPYDKKKRNEILSELLTETRTIVLYEAPHHLKKTLEELFVTLGEKKVTLCRELTKKYETIQRGLLSEMLIYYENNEPRGEYVIVLEGKSLLEKKQERIEQWNCMSLEEHVSYYTENGYDKKEAMRCAAKDRGITKREVYNSLLKKC